jgi:hypothetical protein
MRILTYSERGLLNSVIYSMAASSEPDRLVIEFLKLAEWADGKSPLPASEMPLSVTVLLEQSFSEFGTSDIVILLDGAGSRSVVFGEAKRGPEWTLAQEWEAFLQAVQEPDTARRVTSNIFGQLYLRSRLVNALAEMGANEKCCAPFEPPFAIKRAGGTRHLGSNRLVLSAAGMAEPFLERAHFLMIIPSDHPEDDLDLLKKAAHHPAVKLTGWDPSTWGILPLQRVFDFCRREQLQHALDVIEFNEGQLLAEGSKQHIHAH